MSTKIKIRLFFLTIYLIIVGGFIVAAIIPSGHKTYTFDFNKKNSFISPLSPDERLSGGDKQLPNQIIGNPVYFNLYTPRKFENAKLTIKYKNEQKLPIIEAGILVDKNIWRYQLKPLQNILLDQLSLVWDKSQDDNMLFLQNNYSTTTPIYKTIGQLLSSTTDFSQIAAYNTKLNYNYKIPGYTAEQEKKEYIVNLNSSYQIYTYIKDEELLFDFEFLNLDPDNDTEKNIIILLYYEDIILDSRTLETTNYNEVINTVLKMPNLLEGVYKIEVKTNDNIITKTIKTPQQKISFKNKINLHKTDSNNLILYTDGNNLQVQTIYPQSLQSILVNEQYFSIAETYKQFNWQIYDLSSTTVKTIKLAKDGLILNSDGYFSFQKKQLFNPDLKKVDKYLKNNINKTKYIIADYSSPKYSDMAYSKTLNFNLNTAYRENNTYSFIISIPDLHLGESSAEIEIESISVDLTGDNLLELIKKAPRKIKSLLK